MRVAVVGLGLIGGSLALATNAKGYDAHPLVRAKARERGIDVRDTLAEAVGGAELVVVAVPRAALPDSLLAAARSADRATLTDVASSKKDVEALATALPEGVRFIGGHPMAGSTRRGIESAEASLFRGRPWLLVPTSRTDPAAATLAGALARDVGAEPLVLSAARHEELMTLVSRLPLVVAVGLMRQAGQALEDRRNEPRTADRANAERVDAERAGTDRVHAGPLAAVAGPGFLDTTRLAGTPPELAVELALADPDALADAIDAFVRDVGSLAAVLRAGDAGALRTWLAEGAAPRAQLERTRDSSSAK